MIRRAADKDTRAILEIWLDASRLAHGFIPYEFWLARVGEMENVYLPNSETYVWEIDGEVAAFISLVGEQVAALFVRPAVQGRGFGTKLLDFAKANRDCLSLCVYSKNARAVKFYADAGFLAVEERLDPHTGEAEILMRWTAWEAL
jgi:putative acetyltransferase